MVKSSCDALMEESSIGVTFLDPANASLLLEEAFFFFFLLGKLGMY